jgi:hypothetical protein
VDPAALAHEMISLLRRVRAPVVRCARAETDLPTMSGCLTSLRAAGGRVQISRFWTRQWRHAFGWPASGDALARV